MLSDVIVQFARLWGQHEVLTAPFTEEDEKLSEQLKEYDSEDCMKVLSAWAEEFLSKDNAVEDTVEFFEQKIKEIV